MLSNKKSVLSLQAYYGGSHRQFMDEWIETSRIKWDLMTLPDRHWKWRMRHSAIEFAKLVDAGWSEGKRWDAIFATDMLNVAEFKGLLKSAAGAVPIVVYFHENQFEYPNTEEQSRDLHFAFTNLTTALAADEIWFNSRFNLDSFIGHLQSSMKIWPDFQPYESIDKIRCKSIVQMPGIKCNFQTARQPKNLLSEPIHIVWAARWEHDKNPELLLQILECLRVTNIKFKVSVLGNQFSKFPEAFGEIRKKFSDEIVNFGYQDSRDDYWEVLRQADLYLSTANHEFFGISTVEAIAADCIPVLPNRLSYPELLSIASNPNRRQLLYQSKEEAIDVIRRARNGDLELEMCNQLSQEFRDKFHWKTRGPALDNGIESFIAANNTVANICE